LLGIGANKDVLFSTGGGYGKCYVRVISTSGY